MTAIKRSNRCHFGWIQWPVSCLLLLLLPLLLLLVAMDIVELQCKVFLGHTAFIGFANIRKGDFLVEKLFYRQMRTTC